MMHAPVVSNLVSSSDLALVGLSESPAHLHKDRERDLRICLEDGPEREWRHRERPQRSVGPHRRGAHPAVDQRDLTEVVPGTEGRDGSAVDSGRGPALGDLLEPALFVTPGYDDDSFVEVALTHGVADGSELTPRHLLDQALLPEPLGLGIRLR